MASGARDALSMDLRRWMTALVPGLAGGVILTVLSGEMRWVVVCLLFSSAITLALPSD